MIGRKAPGRKKVQVRGLHTYFARKKVLKGIDIDVYEGESLVIIGGSGSGKSVFIKNLIGLIPSTKGSIKIDNFETSRLNERERNRMMGKMGVLFQGGALFDSLNVWENIAFALLQTKKMDRGAAFSLAVEKLASVGLGAEVAYLYPSELSGGMQKRVALARAIADNPEIIFFDEPTTGLDPIMSDIINNLIIKCSSELRATTITITHDMHSAKKIADRVAMLYDGKIIWEDDVRKLEKSKSPYVQQFINGSAEGPIKMQIQDHYE